MLITGWFFARAMGAISKSEGELKDMNHDHSDGIGKHMLIMLVCCLVPLALIAAVGVFGLSLGPLNGVVPLVGALMCPLMMVVMMRSIMQGQDSETHHRRGRPPIAPTSRPVASVASTVETASSKPEHCH